MKRGADFYIWSQESLLHSKPLLLVLDSYFYWGN